MKTTLAGALLAGAVLVAVPPAGAGELHTLFDLSFRVLEGGFTLGGRVDGRGRTFTFELDANLLDGAMRAVVRRPPERI